jgi:hypothetical protein
VEYSQTVQEFLTEAKEFCLNRADMAQFTDDDFIINDYKALAHHFDHGIKITNTLGTVMGALEEGAALWEPYVELALSILGRELNSISVESA